MLQTAQVVLYFGVVPYELHSESVADSDEDCSPTEPDTGLENTAAQLPDAKPAMQMRPTKGGGNRRERSQHR